MIFGSDELYEQLEDFFYQYQGICNLNNYYKNIDYYFVCNEKFWY